jgi:hypothetical protein
MSRIWRPDEYQGFQRGKWSNVEPSRPGGRQLLRRPAAAIGGLAVIAVVGLSLVLFVTIGRADDPSTQDLVVAGPRDVDQSPVVSEPSANPGPPDSVAGESTDSTEEPAEPDTPGDDGDVDDPTATPPPVGPRSPGQNPARPAPVAPATVTTTTTTFPSPAPPAPDPTDSLPNAPGTTTTTIPGSDLFIPDETPPPETVPGAGRATIDTARAADGGHGYSDKVRLQLSVAEAPAAGNRLFLVCNLTDPAGSPRETWYGKGEVTGTGTRTTDVTFTNPDPAHPSPVGTRWVCGIATADDSAAGMLTLLMEMDERHVVIDPATGLPFDVYRQSLPPGASIISNTIALTIDRVAT